MRYEFFTAVKIHAEVFWAGVMPCSGAVGQMFLRTLMPPPSGRSEVWGSKFL